LISSLIEHAAKYHGATEIVSRPSKAIHRYTYREPMPGRSNWQRPDPIGGQIGRPGGDLGLERLSAFELYFGVSGLGAVLHTVNPRLFPEQVEYIVNHAEDSYVFVDLTFVALLEGLASKLSSVKGYVVMTT